MLRYKSLEIQNYKSIGYALVTFTPGTFAVTGVTADGGYSSNGSGKSTVLQALYLALYNKDFQGAPIGDVSNRFTGKEYKLTLDLFIDRDCVAANYTIINDRANKTITVLKEGVEHVTGVVKSLKLIQELVGMSEATFKFTHYITTNSILELTNNLSNATLFNEVLQVTQLKIMGQDLMDIRKSYQASLEDVKEEFSKLTAAHKLSETTAKHDAEDLRDRLHTITAEIVELQTLSEEHITPLKESIAETKATISDRKNELRHKHKSKSEGVCTLCGSVLAISSSYEELGTDIERLEAEVKELGTYLEKTSSRLEELLTSKDIAIAELNTEKRELEKTLGLVEQVEEMKKEVLDGSFYSKEYYKSIQDKIRYINSMVDHIGRAREAIRSGKIFEDIMEEFFKLVNKNIQRYKKVINFNNFDIHTSSYRSGMLIVLKNDNHEIPVESLSNGEKARLSLLVLSALLESMQQTTQSDSNFIVFDEATSSFDKSGIKELQSLFGHLKRLGQSCFIITHGEELAEVDFDGHLVVEKRDNVATVTFIKD